MQNESSVRMIVSGKVQGVSFRWYSVRIGRNLKLKGYAKNLPDGSVEILVEGKTSDLETFIRKVKVGPNLARVDHVAMEWGNLNNAFDNFEIRYV
ncbi:MAG: acylphosphatase [Candidatus Marinimicrobia bacterium]|nr:acylphosphatase [Candidatus Neomarinimicrobiota bacterium]MBL7009762.1 acylphosphatase [Candidatus Neomarinimicrobiota bacterium]MBL7029834.1 acylphosphatase [Candidatus Neomarinimicrobiota bacterium]